MAENRLPVMEIFGPTVQGEGMVIGRKTMFVRLAGCDYRCVWCDSAFTWDGSAKEEIRMMSAHEAVEALRETGGETFAHVTISGGNPALYPQVGELIERLHERDIRVAVETQGSRWQDWFPAVDELTLSPKPPSSGMVADWRVLDEIVDKLKRGRRTGSFSLKIVVFDETDLRFAAGAHERYPDVPFYLQAGNGERTETDSRRLLTYLTGKYEWLIGRVMEHDKLKNVYVLPQLHAWVWGNKRGV
ncbi:7-carboxy-7-deazaguanine synthase QueE [Cohnella massiliensis]|uniref:7-carboxy-7-deazaguanine synthase QueE n=1 Tax=Cohnella massiliensis TaxID=1816691 RepID=UPI0009B96277|nr:7-carboxy-7-deazaguanine synthase QueE [Cohnella massiliensis]